MKVTFKDHNGMGRRIAAALTDAGHELAPDGGDVALIDADVPFPPYSTICDGHDRVLIYPHGGGHNVADGQWPVHRNTVCRFVPAAGHAEVLGVCRYPVPVEVLGWPLCDIRPFTPTSPVTVLLAPQHQMFDGWLPAGSRERNARIHDLLANLPGVQLVVRYVQVARFGIEHLGITRRPSVTYRPGTFDVTDAVAAIDTADVVVAAEGSFPSLAIARGRPTVMYAQIPPEDHQNFSDTTHPPLAWDLYRDIVRYPYDADDTDDIAGLLEQACSDDTPITDWRTRFIGADFDPELFVKTFDRYAA